MSAMSSTKRSITISIPGVPDVALRKNKADETHWRYRQKATKTMRENAWALVVAQFQASEYWNERRYGHPLFDKASILITQYYCGKPLDPSGLAAATAPAVDAFVDAGVIKDDQPDKYITDYRMHYVRVPHRDDARVEITITEAE